MSVRLSGGAFAVAVALVLAGCGGSSHSHHGGPTPQVAMRVVSSAPDQVSGGDARLALSADASLLEDVTLTVNDKAVDMAGFHAVDDHLEGMVTGLVDGENTVLAQGSNGQELGRITLTNYPIEGPIFSGPHQEPFVCTTTSELGLQPKVDSDTPPGFEVQDDAGNVIGYSRDCSLDRYTVYVYRSTDNTYKPLPDDGSRPADMATTTLMDGRTVDFVVRWERGTINRFIYSVAMLAEADDEPGSLDDGLWNKRLMYIFQGGVGIGHTQGRVDVEKRALRPDILGQGYAIIYSTGNRMGEHYNMQLGGETALMVKERFLELYGEPLYTVGLGTSGGAIQQYIYAQNLPGLIDAAIPQQSYPDMVTQTIHVGDCELLEYYMDATDRDNDKWETTKNRIWLVGLHATDAVEDKLYKAKRDLGYSGAPGSTECIEAWRGLTPLTMNPYYGQAPNQEMMRPVGIMDTVNWSHYDDLRNIYGLRDDGYPNTLFDNVGVQYGLQALFDGNIDGDEFLKLNAEVGGWKDQKDMIQEGFPFLGEPDDVAADPSIFDPWSSRNMTLSNDPAVPAPRTTGSMQAMNAAYTSGMVFRGDAPIPIIDWRPYLEEQLDMHNVHQSFVTRQRMIDYAGNADNQVIWFTDARPKEAFDNVPMAMKVIDEWMANIFANPERSVAENKPADAEDACFATDGTLIKRGADVWDGVLNGKADGACTKEFPMYTTSRIVAGAPMQGDVFKCALKPVDTAVTDGTYGSWNPDSSQITRLKAIFPDGVCDYSKPDQGRPKDL